MESMRLKSRYAVIAAATFAASALLFPSVVQGELRMDPRISVALAPDPAGRRSADLPDNGLQPHRVSAD